MYYLCCRETSFINLILFYSYLNQSVLIKKHSLQIYTTTMQHKKENKENTEKDEEFFIMRVMVSFLL